MKPPISLFLFWFGTCACLKLNHNTDNDYRVCEKQSCVKKCCPENHVLKNKQCVLSENVTFSFDVYDGNTKVTNRDITFNVIHDFNTKCKGENLKLSRFIENDLFYVQSDGSLYKPLDNDTRYVKFEQYCLETFILPTREEFSAVVCYQEELLGKIDQFSVFGMIISMPFLFITFLVYMILPERNVHRRALINYVFSLLCGYIFLVTVQLFKNDSAPIPDTQCHLLGYAIVFFFIVSFFWMNVMCIDMWLAFSGMRGFTGRRNAEKKKFILFCLYAWGMPALLVLIIFLMNTYADKKATYHPRLGETRCFLEEGYPNLYYFYTPMAILIASNIILCILTAVKIVKVKRETSMLQQGDSKRHSYENDKQKFKLYIKLIFAMGINWSMEVISWIILWQWHDIPSYVWYLTDFTNAAYGVFIFFIFVFKKNVWIQLKKQYYIWRGQPHLAHTLSSNLATRTSNFSSVDTTTVNMDHRLSELKNGKLEEKPLSIS